MRIDLSKADPRFRVPDLTPKERPRLKSVPIRYWFVAESPHTSEIAESKLSDRRPLCGAAGKKWWKLLYEVCSLDGATDWSDELSSEYLGDFCQRLGISMMNAVQYPLDPGIEKKVPLASPVKNLGFQKGSGPLSYKRMKKSPEVQEAFSSLRERLRAASDHGRGVVICLGRDAEWFVHQVWDDSLFPNLSLAPQIPHPSAWWRKGGYFGEVAKKRLSDLFEKGEGLSS